MTMIFELNQIQSVNVQTVSIEEKTPLIRDMKQYKYKSWPNPFPAGNGRNYRTELHTRTMRRFIVKTERVNAQYCRSRHLPTQRRTSTKTTIISCALSKQGAK